MQKNLIARSTRENARLASSRPHLRLEYPKMPGPISLALIDSAARLQNKIGLGVEWISTRNSDGHCRIMRNGTGHRSVALASVERCIR